MLIWNHKHCRQLAFAHLGCGEWAWPWSYSLSDQAEFSSLVHVFGFSQQIIFCFIVKKWVLWKYHSPRGQWGPVSPGQEETTLYWKGHRKETSKRLFEAVLEHVLGRNLCPVGFPGYQYERSLSFLKNKRKRNRDYRVWLSLCHALGSLTWERNTQQPRYRTGCMWPNSIKSFSRGRRVSVEAEFALRRSLRAQQGFQTGFLCHSSWFGLLGIL